ncbi:cupin domain-containing protein [Negadavirga shengliensis]|uniref:Cupin domain-containing protein n=1 Tax=Negadavirga shengliensis TaxID=1389218 RepID=A0ABV9SWU3_9BACT
MPEKLYFDDDGVIPNSHRPLLLYRDVFSHTGEQAAEWLESKFSSNNWTNGWRWGVYPFHHYHSNTHEVLGVFKGSALLLLGGDNGKEVQVNAGDVIIIPAGVAHKCLSHTNGFTVVGAYPNGLKPDMRKGEAGERPQADKQIAAVPVPETDPLYGTEAGLVTIWK